MTKDDALEEIRKSTHIPNSAFPSYEQLFDSVFTTMRILEKVEK